MSSKIAGKTNKARDITHDAVILASSSQEKVDALGMMKTRQGKLALDKIMVELVDYTVMHFGMEEKLFAGDPTVSINLMTFLKD